MNPHENCSACRRAYDFRRSAATCGVAEVTTVSRAGFG